MHKPISLLSLPVSLLLLISSTPAHTGTSTHDAQWPYDLPPHAKYYPEDEHIVRRDLEIQDRLAYQIPAGVQKMSGDEGEKFLMTYWRFDFRDPEEEGRQRISIPKTRGRAGESFELDDVGPNATSSRPLLPPFLLHTADEQTPHNNRFLRFPRAVRSSLEERGFQCPAGTSNCQGIDRPNSCCANGETCQLITDAGLGDVGCCGQGQTCSGRVTTCDAGYTSCPNNPGGGCCIPGYSCVDIGCAISSTSTIVITPTVTASPSPSPRPSSSSPTTSSSPAPTTTSASSSVIAIVPVPPPSSSSPPSPSTTPTSSTPAQGSLTCSPGYQSCPATLGGGCCPTDRACGANECPASTSPSQSPSTSTSPSATTTTSTTSNPAAAAPVRPTSIVSAVTTTSTGTGTVAAGTDTACPTGFYQCSAYYSGGCCRVGRDCGVTSCPTGASSSILVSNGVTVVVASGGAVSVDSGSGSGSASGSAGSTSTSAPMTTTTAAGNAGGGGTGAGGGSCASGWYSCASSNGGGCCPSGYVCGASCTASVSGSATAGSVGKIAASAAAPAVLGRGLMVGIGVWVWVGVVGLFGVRVGL